MNKKPLSPKVKKCLAEIMEVTTIPGAPIKRPGSGVEKTIKTTNQVIDALAAGRIDAKMAKKLIAKIAADDIERASDSAGYGCRY